MTNNRVTVKELRSELLERGAYPYEVAIDVLFSRINWITPTSGEVYITRVTANAYMKKFLSNPMNTSQGRLDRENARFAEKKTNLRGNQFSERQAILTWGNYIEEKRAIVYKEWKSFSRKRKEPTMSWQEKNEENERLYQEYRKVSDEQHDVPKDWKNKEMLRLGYQELKAGIQSYKEGLDGATTGIGREFFSGLLKDWEPILEEFRLELGVYAELDHVPFPGEEMPIPPPPPEKKKPTLVPEPRNDPPQSTTVTKEAVKPVVSITTSTEELVKVHVPEDKTFNLVGFRWTKRGSNHYPRRFRHAKVKEFRVWVRGSGTGLVRVASTHDLTGYFVDFGVLKLELSKRKRGIWVAGLTKEEVKKVIN